MSSRVAPVAITVVVMVVLDVPPAFWFPHLTSGLPLSSSTFPSWAFLGSRVLV